MQTDLRYLHILVQKRQQLHPGPQRVDGQHGHLLAVFYSESVKHQFPSRHTDADAVEPYLRAQLLFQHAYALDEQPFLHVLRGEHATDDGCQR